MRILHTPCRKKWEFHKLMNKLLLRFVCFIIGMFIIVNAQETPVFKAGVSLERQVPSSLMGTWRVAATLKSTDSPQTFKNVSVDIWNLSRTNDVISLSNPFTGASASINVSYVNKNTIKFTKVGDYDTQKLTDSVEITISGDTFTGKNSLRLVTYSDVDNSVLSEKTALYILKGEKISGSGVIEK